MIDCSGLTRFVDHGAGSVAAEATQNDRKETPIHSSAHDVTQYGTAAADQCTSHDKQVVCKHKTGRCRCPARITIQHGDHDRHVSTADRHHHMDTKT